jgi:hypothetical protein
MSMLLIRRAWLRDLQAALKYARRHALFTAAETIEEHGHLVRSHRIEIEDAQGTVLGTVRFEDVISIED